MAQFDRGDLAERQPLLHARRLSTREDERWRFEQAQRQAVGDVALSSGGLLGRLLKLIVFLFIFGILSLSLYIYFRSLWVIAFHLDSPCDQPLGQWLAGWILFPIVQRMIDPPPPRRSYYHHFRLMFFHCSWFSLGASWVAMCKSCQQTNPVLFNWVHFVIHVYVVMVCYIVLAPILIALACVLALNLFRILIDYGWISNPKAASKDTVEKLEVVPYDPSLFSEDAEDDRPSGECCCCTEAFGPDKTIVRTTCNHLYHKSCLGEWLRLARTCPLCRYDLDAATSGNDAVACLPVDIETRTAPASEIAMEGTFAVEGDEDLARRLQEEEFNRAGFP